MNPIFQKNLAEFKLKTPSLRNLSEQVSPSIETFPSKSGMLTARYKEILLHSSYDPIKEAATFASDINPGSRIGLYGFGLGYHVEAILDKIGAEGELIVIELNSDILATCFGLRDLTHLAKDPRFNLVFANQENQAAEQISHAMGTLGRESPRAPVVLFHPSSYECLPEQFPNILRALEVVRLERKVPALFGNLEKRNAKINWDQVKKLPGISQLKNRFHKQPAVLISAGPSLDGVLPFLPVLLEKCVVGCVDTALPTIEAAEIHPQFIFSVDPQEESFSHFENHLSSPASLIFQPTAYPKIICHYEGEKFVVFKDGHHTTQKYPSLANEKGITRAGGSVSCLALDCLIQMGCDPIFLVGQDCSFPGGRVYGRKGTGHLEEGQIISRETSAGELQNVRSRRYEKLTVTGSQGQTLFTSPSLFSYLRTIEQIAEANPEVRIFNLSSQGASIERATSIGSLNELMNLLPDCGTLK